MPLAFGCWPMANYFNSSGKILSDFIDKKSRGTPRASRFNIDKSQYGVTGTNQFVFFVVYFVIDIQFDLWQFLQNRFHCQHFII